MPRRCTQARLPLGPLMGRTGFDVACIEAPCRNGGTREVWAGQAFLSELVGASKTKVRSWIVSGIPLDQAEDAAFALGLHPCEVWDNWFDFVVSPASVPDRRTQ